MSRRTLLYFVLAALFCAQLQAAQPRALHPAPFEHHDELMDQLMHGTPKLRAHAQFRLAQMGTRISLELTSKLSSAKRPATPWSFAMKLRRYLDGEANVVEAMNYLNSRMYAVLNPKMQNAGPADLPQFAGYVKRTSNDEEVFQKIQALPYIAGASQENADAMASLLDHSHVGLQNAALTGLERYCSFAVLPTKVEPFLKSKSIEQFMSAARILARQKHDGVIDAVLTRVRSEPLVLASTLAPIFADCDRAELLPKLNELLQDADPRMQTVAAGYLLALNDSKDAAEAKLVEQLGATIPDVQISAAWVLYELGSDKVKETVRAKINLARPQLNRVFLGATGWLSEKPDGKKHAQEIAKLSLVNAAAPTGEWAINLRDQLRLGLHKEVNEVVRASAVAIADEVGAPALPPKAPIPAKPAANNTAKPKVMRTYKFDRYAYSIMATVLSELDPDAYQKSIKACVTVITSRQLGCGLWSYRDATQKEQDEFGDGYEAASATDYEFPQAFYALEGLESAIVFADVKVERVVFLRAMRGLLYSQNVDGSFNNYPNPSPYPQWTRAEMAVQHTAWGLGMLAICLRQGKEELGDEPDVLVRGYIARQAAYTCLRERVLLEPPGEIPGQPGTFLTGALFQLRELAFTFGNDGLMTRRDAAGFDQSLKMTGANAMLYTCGFPEPADSTSRPWEEATDIGIGPAKK